MTADIKPFRISVSDDILADLKARLRNTRWPEAEAVDDWSQGTPLKWIKEVCTYWAEQYDWRRREALLNRFAQFATASNIIRTVIPAIPSSRRPGRRRWAMG
jgi:hypothetical protein